MPEENGWDDVIEQEEKPLETQEVPTEPVAEIPNEAIDRDIPETPAEEDPDAWRTVRFEEDASAVHKLLMDAAERSPAVKRALASATSLKREREFREREIELTEQLEAERRGRMEAEKGRGDLFWGRMTDEQRGQYLAKNPQHMDHYSSWVQLSRQVQSQQQQQQVPAWVKSLVNDARGLVDQYAVSLPEEYETQLRTTLADPQTFANYRDRPHQLIIDLKESIDDALARVNNGAVQVDATPRVPAPASARTRNDPPVQASPANPALGKFAPDTTRPVGSSGGGSTYTRAEIDEMDDDAYAGLLKRNGASSGQELYRRGIIVD